MAKKLNYPEGTSNKLFFPPPFFALVLQCVVEDISDLPGLQPGDGIFVIVK